MCTEEPCALVTNNLITFEAKSENLFLFGAVTTYHSPTMSAAHFLPRKREFLRTLLTLQRLIVSRSVSNQRRVLDFPQHVGFLFCQFFHKRHWGVIVCIESTRQRSIRLHVPNHQSQCQILARCCTCLDNDCIHTHEHGNYVPPKVLLARSWTFAR